jgi:isopenicillin-N N-acyltransferase like protein
MAGSAPGAGGLTVAVAFQYVQARGGYRELGQAVGEAAREQVAAALAYYREHFPAMAGIEFAEAERRAQEYLKCARRYLPQYVEELEGLAEGALQSLSALMVPNCGEEFTCDAEVKGTSPGVPGGRRLWRAGRLCTAVAVSNRGRHVVGHNMDWYAVDVDKNVLFDLTMPDGTRVLTIAGVPYLPMLGMSSHGIASVSNSVYCNDARVGVPNSFVRRWVLDAASIGEGRERACLVARARGSNHIWADGTGRMCDLETSATGSADVESEGWLAHTNHYVAADMAPFEASQQPESRDRLRRARELLDAGVARGDDPVAVVAAVLRDHANAPDAICGHPTDRASRPDESVTVASMICDLDNGRLYACAGPPCENPYRMFDL